ncbi:hypothetical protein [Comamonas sp. wu1-DMT]|uniref:hypothetical protein n=1 Tax=Comamonas sp. wu1-DMT TaxID=3126390 RepID=UPI0032E3773A
MINENEKHADEKPNVNEQLAHSRENFARAARAAKPISPTTLTGGVSLAKLKAQLEQNLDGREFLTHFDIRRYTMNTTKFNAWAAHFAVTKPDIGHPDVVGSILKKARDTGAAGLLITPIADEGLAVRAAECPDHIPASLITLPGGPSLLLSTDTDATDAAGLLIYLQMLGAELPVPPFFIISLAMSAVAAIRLDTGLSALTYLIKLSVAARSATAANDRLWRKSA